MLEIADIRKRFGKVNALDGCSFSVERGRMVGFLGPNGAGKTTTAGMLTTRVIPTSGTALIGGIDVVAQPALVKQLIGVVSQHLGHPADRLGMAAGRGNEVHRDDLAGLRAPRLRTGHQDVVRDAPVLGH